jgi:hypothetical protein
VDSFSLFISSSHLHAHEIFDAGTTQSNQVGCVKFVSFDVSGFSEVPCRQPRNQQIASHPAGVLLFPLGMTPSAAKPKAITFPNPAATAPMISAASQQGDSLLRLIKWLGISSGAHDQPNRLLYDAFYLIIFRVSCMGEDYDFSD